MSDTEARERRRAKILAAKDDRMARIVGSVSGSSSEASETAKISKPSDKITVKPKNGTDIKKAIPIVGAQTKPNVAPLESESKSSNNVSHKGTESLPVNQTITSNIRHVSILLFAAILFTLLSQKCSVLAQYFQLDAKNWLCPVLERAPWSIMISIFLAIEFGEFLFGHLQCAKGTNMMIVKDLCLYLFVILIFSQI